MDFVFKHSIGIVYCTPEFYTDFSQRGYDNLRILDITQTQINKSDILKLLAWSPLFEPIDIERDLIPVYTLKFERSEKNEITLVKATKMDENKD